MAAEDWSENVYVAHLADDPAFSDELEQLERRLEQDSRHVVLDLSSVTFLNSSNLSQLIRIRNLTGQGGCRVMLCGVRPEVMSTFQVSGLAKVFAFAQSVPLALASLQLAASRTDE